MAAEQDDVLSLADSDGESSFSGFEETDLQLSVKARSGDDVTTNKCQKKQKGPAPKNVVPKPGSSTRSKI